MPNRVLAFVRDLLPRSIPEPPPVIKESPGAYIYFMDEDEREILYRKPWPYVACPVDDRVNATSTEWVIGGQRFNPARRDADGNWIFRRCEN